VKSTASAVEFDPVPATTGDPAAGRLDHRGHDALVLLVRQRRRLAGRAARDEAVRPVGHVEVDQLPQLRLVDLSVAERGHQRDERTLEGRLAHGLVSFAAGASSTPGDLMWG
jgi:hypothetical protein